MRQRVVATPIYKAFLQHSSDREFILSAIAHFLIHKQRGTILFFDF
jgi:hypothetical protein